MKKTVISFAIKPHRVYPSTDAVNSQEEDLHDADPDKSFPMDDFWMNLDDMSSDD